MFLFSRGFYFPSTRFVYQEVPEPRDKLPNQAETLDRVLDKLDRENADVERDLESAREELLSGEYTQREVYEAANAVARDILGADADAAQRSYMVQNVFHYLGLDPHDIRIHSDEELEGHGLISFDRFNHGRLLHGGVDDALDEGRPLREVIGSRGFTNEDIVDALQTRALREARRSERDREDRRSINIYSRQVRSLMEEYARSVGIENLDWMRSHPDQPFSAPMPEAAEPRRRTPEPSPPEGGEEVELPVDPSRTERGEEAPEIEEAEWGTIMTGLDAMGTATYDVVMNSPDFTRTVQQLAHKEGGDLGSTGIDGQYGPKTREAVRVVQRKLQSEGKYDGNIDGLFGEQTIRGATAYVRERMGGVVPEPPTEERGGGEVVDTGAVSARPPAGSGEPAEPVAPVRGAGEAGGVAPDVAATAPETVEAGNTYPAVIPMLGGRTVQLTVEEVSDGGIIIRPEGVENEALAVHVAAANIPAPDDLGEYYNTQLEAENVHQNPELLLSMAFPEPHTVRTQFGTDVAFRWDGSGAVVGDEEGMIFNVEYGSLLGEPEDYRQNLEPGSLYNVEDKLKEQADDRMQTYLVDHLLPTHLHPLASVTDIPLDGDTPHAINIPGLPPLGVTIDTANNSIRIEETTDPALITDSPFFLSESGGHNSSSLQGFLNAFKAGLSGPGEVNAPQLFQRHLQDAATNLFDQAGAVRGTPQQRVERMLPSGINTRIREREYDFDLAMQSDGETVRITYNPRNGVDVQNNVIDVSVSDLLEPGGSGHPPFDRTDMRERILENHITPYVDGLPPMTQVQILFNGHTGILLADMSRSGRTTRGIRADIAGGSIELRRNRSDDPVTVTPGELIGDDPTKWTRPDVYVRAQGLMRSAGATS